MKGVSDTGPDTVGLYLSEIGQVALLTAEEERTLGRAIRAGREAAIALEASGLERTERRNLRRLVEEGERAREHMVRANLRLVVSIARRHDRRELQIQDLIQEGNIGLMHAVDKYDPEKGFKFSTYATWWIRQAMTRAMADQGRNIRIPGHMMEIVNRVQRVERELSASLGRPPTPEEVAERSGLTVERLLEVHQITLSTASLDAPVGQESDDLTLGDTVASRGEDDDPSEVAVSRQRSEAINQVIDGLPERDKEIVCMRFGIGPHYGRTYTLEEVAAEMGVTRERVRQIEQKTLARLRHPNNSGNLRAFHDED